MTTDGGRRRLTELVFLHRGPLVLRALVVVVVAAGCGAAGVALFRLHEDLARRLAAGAALNVLQTFVARGSGPATLWPGWLAALCFLIALVRLRRGPLEPAPGRRTPERRTIAQLRRGLRREYRAVRIVLVVLALVTAVDAARAVSFAAGAQRSGVSPFTVWAMYVEAAGLVAATLTLAAYAWSFGADIARLGA